MKRLMLLLLIMSIWSLQAETVDVSRLSPLGFAFPDQPMTSPSIKAYRGDTQVDLMDQNKVTLLYFWSEITPSSLSDLPLLESLKDELADLDILIAPVNLNEDYPVVQKIVKQMNLTLEIYYFPEPGPLAPYILKTVPAAYILNKKGQLVASVQGNAPWGHPDILRTLKELAAE
ncbi:hypothetical protein EXM22_08105 [Oceanispirochaeta crateris]|uniref:Thioredoxin domain-containing protein n=1 Tax=Oceanispirochaeta crateris TaxID=2518645 RepID=A0A5C1QKF3_9SPIO|nr:hypothetical protein [Oceanispirochaeta crateris]QEN07947.1 hypothetical protein EXM22_08105 [Oceanispirochaeta crateris]